MNVLFLALNVREPGARDRITYGFIVKEMRALAARGERIFFLAQHTQEHETSDGVSYLARDQVLGAARARRKFENLIFVLRHLRFFWRFLLLDPMRTFAVVGVERAVKRIISEQRIDVIHTHFFYPAGECAIIAGETMKIPIVATLRGAELYERQDLQYGSLSSRFVSWMLRKSLPRVMRITAPNRTLAARLETSFGVSRERIEYLPNGVELDIEVPDREPDPGSFRMIAIGRLIHRKNYQRLIEAMATLDQRSFSLTIIGQGPVEEGLRALARELRVVSVEFRAEVAKADLYVEIARSHVLVHPSLIEGMPNVVLESLLVGRPCLVSDIPPHREIIEEDRTGYFFHPEDVCAIAGVLKKAASRRQALGEMKTACQARAAAFSLDRKIERYTSIYREVVGGFERDPSGTSQPKQRDGPLHDPKPPKS